MTKFLLSWVIFPMILFAAGFASAWKVDEWRHGAAETKAVQTVVKVVEKQGVTNQTIAVAAQAAHDRIVYRTQTLIQKVPEYVPAQAAHDCVVPTGFVLLLNASARPDLFATPAITPELAGSPSGVDLDTVAQSAVANYGSANLTASQLNAILDWAQASGLMQPAPK